jgi:hypothetical protein
LALLDLKGRLVLGLLALLDQQALLDLVVLRERRAKLEIKELQELQELLAKLV